jgi:hypothetical protein
VTGAKPQLGGRERGQPWPVDDGAHPLGVRSRAKAARAARSIADAADRFVRSAAQPTSM